MELLFIRVLIFISSKFNIWGRVFIIGGLSYFIALRKIWFQGLRFLGFLLVVEFLVILTLTLLVFFRLIRVRGRIIFFFLVLRVCLSCLGLALMVSIVQGGVKEIELFFIKL